MRLPRNIIENGGSMSNEKLTMVVEGTKKLKLVAEQSYTPNIYTNKVM